jgi:DNA topoisomerase-2
MGMGLNSATSFPQSLSSRLVMLPPAKSTSRYPPIASNPQTFTSNMGKKGTPVITDHASMTDYTMITFSPDLDKFGMTELDADIEALFQKRAYDMAGVVPNVKVFLNGERIKVKGFKQYVDLYVKRDGEGEKREVVYERVNKRWEVAVTTSEGQFNQVRYRWRFNA